MPLAVYGECIHVYSCLLMNAFRVHSIDVFNDFTESVDLITAIDSLLLHITLTLV